MSSIVNGPEEEPFVFVDGAALPGGRKGDEELVDLAKGALNTLPLALGFAAGPLGYQEYG